MNKHVSKIVDEPKRRAFVSDDFREKVLSNGLVGFKFVLVWDSDGSLPEYHPISSLK